MRLWTWDSSRNLLAYTDPQDERRDRLHTLEDIRSAGFVFEPTLARATMPRFQRDHRAR